MEVGASGGEGGISRYDLGALEAARGGCFLVGRGAGAGAGAGEVSLSELMIITGGEGGGGTGGITGGAAGALGLDRGRAGMGDLGRAGRGLVWGVGLTRRRSCRWINSTKSPVTFPRSRLSIASL